MDFVYDPVKSLRNKAKHGIDFEDAKMLWSGSFLEFPLRSEDETRFGVIGIIGNRHWTAVITYRETNVRIISVRRSRREEKRVYEKFTKENQG